MFWASFQKILKVGRHIVSTRSSIFISNQGCCSDRLIYKQMSSCWLAWSVIELKLVFRTMVNNLSFCRSSILGTHRLLFYFGNVLCCWLVLKFLDLKGRVVVSRTRTLHTFYLFPLSGTLSRHIGLCVVQFVDNKLSFHDSVRNLDQGCYPDLYHRQGNSDGKNVCISALAGVLNHTCYSVFINVSHV